MRRGNAPHAGTFQPVPGTRDRFHSSRSEREVEKTAPFANSFTIATFDAQSVKRIEHRLWSNQRGKSWFQTTLLHLGIQNFKACFRVMRRTFHYLVDVCRPTMEGTTTNMQTPISVERRVAIALYKLCSTTEDKEDRPFH